MNRFSACGIIAGLLWGTPPAPALAGTAADSVRSVAADSLRIAAADSAGFLAPVSVRSVPADTAWLDPRSLPDTSAAAPFSQFFKNVGGDLAAQASAPFSMSTSQAAYAAAGISITLGLVALDATIDRNINMLAAKAPLVGTVSSAITDFGGPYGILSAAAYTGYSLIWADEGAQQTSVLLAQSLITSALWTRLGKIAAGRERPSASYEISHLPGGRWYGPAGPLSKLRTISTASYDAFPSGHTATAFAIATVFAMRHRDSDYIPAISYSLATVIGFTRMVRHTHWASDVFAGACIGYLCADQVVTRFEEGEAAKAGARKKANMRLSLGILNESPALQFAVRF